jgi:hypothetical protein
MGRVKVPRCDNCGAPVEFAKQATEARCEYCGELLIRELQAPKPVWAPPAAPPLPPPPPRVVTRKGTVAPFMLVGMATLAIAGASSFASLAPRLTPLPEAAPLVEPRSLAVATPLQVERTPTAPRPAELRNGTATERARPLVTADTGASRARLRPRPTAASPAASPAAPPALPRFDSQAAIAGLDAAKAKAEASCRGTTGVRLFVQMGFDADGVNRGAALSDPKLGGTPEAKCTLRIFRAVRIPPFDPKTRSSGLGRPVRL